MQRKLRFVLPAIVVLLALPAATANAVARMPVGFFDDPSFRWSNETSTNLLSTQRTHSSIVHILANWSTIAPTKPANALNGNDPAYHLSDVDALVRSAQQYGFEVLLTIAQTPKWANGGKTPNYPPTNMNTLTQFAQMLATRYNGAKPGVGTVRRFSVWNEPNLGLFLAPQFRERQDRQPDDLREALRGRVQGDQGRKPERARRRRRDVEPREEPSDGERRYRLGRAGHVRPPALARRTRS